MKRIYSSNGRHAGKYSRQSMVYVLIIILAAIALALLVSVVHKLTVEPEAPEEPQESAEYIPEPDTMKAVGMSAGAIVEPVESEIEPAEETYDPDMGTYDPADLELMAIVIYCEAGSDSCSDETRIMVGNVVLNRVADSRFPDTIEGVLTAPRQYGLFYWTGVIWPDRAAEEPEAVERAYECAKRVLEGETLLDSDVVWQSEHIQGTEIVAYQDGIYFCR